MIAAFFFLLSGGRNVVDAHITVLLICWIRSCSDPTLPSKKMTAETLSLQFAELVGWFSEMLTRISLSNPISVHGATVSGAWVVCKKADSGMHCLALLVNSAKFKYQRYQWTTCSDVMILLFSLYLFLLWVSLGLGLCSCITAWLI